MYATEYVSPILVVDSVIFQVIDGQLQVLLIKRAAEPFEGWWALPGAYCAAGETTGSALERILHTKAGLSSDNLKLIEQLYTFDTVARDPRGHAVSVTYMSLGKDLTPVHSDSTQQPTFFAVNNLPDVAYDHKDIIKYAHDRLKSKLGYTNACFALLPPQFTLSQLQTTYEAVLGRELDKRNFRKKFMSLELVEDTGEMLREGPHRPAHLYRFSQQKLQSLDRSFD